MDTLIFHSTLTNGRLYLSIIRNYIGISTDSLIKYPNILADMHGRLWKWVLFMDKPVCLLICCCRFCLDVSPVDHCLCSPCLTMFTVLSLAFLYTPVISGHWYVSRAILSGGDRVPYRPMYINTSCGLIIITPLSFVYLYTGQGEERFLMACQML